MSGVTVTEYYAVPERWFKGAKVTAPGLPGRYRADFLYSARGVFMEGSGVADDGRMVSVLSWDPALGWVRKDGRRTRASDGFKAGPPFWWGSGWRNASGAVTFPLSAGGWSAGPSARYIPVRRTQFGLSSERLKPWGSIAVDPNVIPLGSRVYVPAYRGKPGGGWFLAQDTGGAIRGRHIDVYRPADEDGFGRLDGQRILVLPPAR